MKLSSLNRYAGALLLASLFSSVGHSQISFTGNYTQNFNGLILSGNVPSVFSNSTTIQAAIPSTDNSTIGWSGTKIGGNGPTPTNFTADTGSSQSGFIYSYGSASSTDRALGMLASGSNVFAVGAEFNNSSNGTITSLTITYTGEYWRTASNNGTVNTLTFGYGFSGGTAASSNYLSSSGLIGATNLNLVGPTPVATGAALNGNVSGNQTAVNATLLGLNWAPGTSLFIRWQDANDGGNDAGLAIDDFSMSGTIVFSKDVSIGGNTTFSALDFGGNTTFTPVDNAVFDGAATTVTLSGNVTAGGLKFNTTGYTLVGTAPDSLTLSSGSISTGTDVTADISATLAGPAGLTKVGSGTLNLSGNNTFVGPINLIAGRVNIASESALGAATNGVVLGGTLGTTGSLNLGANRTLSGSGVIETGTSQSLTLGGNVSATSLTVNGATSLAFNGASNSIGSLTLAQPAAVSIGGGALAITSGLTLGGTTTLTGPINFGSTSPTLQVNGTSFTPSGTVSTTNRIIKTGAGLLDLTSTTLTANGTSAGFRFGVQGSAPQEGGTLKIDQASDLGTAAVLQFNSGTLDVTTPLSIASGISVGGRSLGVASRPTLSGSPITFTGNNSFFAATNASGDIALVVNNNTTVNGNFAATVIPTNGNQLVLPATFIDLSGTGNLTLTGNATAIYDSFYVNGGLTLVVNGSLGSDVAQFDSGTTVSGNGSFTGYHIFPSGTGNSTVTEAYKSSSVSFYSGSTLAPSGALKFLTNLTLDPGSSTVLDINGPTIGTGYDSVDVSIPTGQATITSYTLTTNGSLALNVAAPASTGNYTLFTTGAGVSRAGSFSSVTLTGGYSGTLSGNSTTTSGNLTFTFEQSTGVLTVADNAPPISANANLSALSLSGVTLSPSFDPATISYTATVANAVNNVTLFTTVQESNAVAKFSSITVPDGGLGIPVVVGSNSIPVVVTAQDGVTTKTYTITLTRSPSALEAWRTLNFPGSTATTGDGRDNFDFDGDGVVNLLEYATDTDAKIANASPVTVAQVGNFLTLSYPVIADANLTYTVQGTNDLGAAFTTGAGATTGTTVKTYTDTVDLSAPGARRFLRLQVTATVTP